MENLEISSRKLEIGREYFMHGWTETIRTQQKQQKTRGLGIILCAFKSASASAFFLPSFLLSRSLFLVHSKNSSSSLKIPLHPREKVEHLS